MKFDEYQERIIPFDMFDAGEWNGDLTEAAFIEKVLGLAGEAGEVEDKIKKVIRDDGGKLSEEKREGILKELGDTLWYVATIARYLGVPLEYVARENVEKLQSRLERGRLSGSGDER